jgi:hypothetical protein
MKASWRLALIAPCTFVANGFLYPTHTNYHVVKHTTIGSIGEGYYADFLALDPVNRRLYGFGNAIIDLDQDRKVGTIGNKVPGGYALATDLGVGLARNGILFDLKTGKVTGRVAAHGDASVYDPTTHRAFLLDDTVAVIDMLAGRVIARRVIAPEFESGVADGKGKLFINREDSSILTRVDARSMAVDARYPIPNCRAAQGLSMDREHRRLFVGCDSQMVVVDADNGHVVARIPVTGHADENAFDPGTGLAFNANYDDSTLTVVHQDSPDYYVVVQQARIGGKARSVVVDDRTHLVYAYYYDLPAGKAETDTAAYTLIEAVLAP